MKRILITLGVFAILVGAYFSFGFDSSAKLFTHTFQGKWLPNINPFHVGAENYTTLKNLRYTDTGKETIEGYSKITTSALGSGSYEMLSGFQFLSDDESHVLTKVSNSGVYEIYKNVSSPPSQGNYQPTAFSDYKYDSFNLDSSIGTFTYGPAGTGLYGDSNGAYIFSAVSSSLGESSVDPAIVFLSTDTTLPITNIFDKTEESIDTTQSFTFASTDELYIASPYKVRHFRFTLSSANVSTSTTALTYWNGSSWASTSENDGTASGGISFAQSGKINISDGSLSVSAIYINGTVMYLYRFTLSAGTCGISHISLGIPIQPVKDFWNGSGRTCISFQVYRDSTYIDYTHHVAQQSTEDAPFAAILGGLDTSDYVYMMFEDKIMGFDINMLGFMYSNGYSYGSIDDIEFWDGDSFVSVTGIIDETDSDGLGGSLQRDGAVSWAVTSSYLPQKIKRFGVYGYLYRVSFNNPLLETKNFTISSSISFSGSVVTAATTIGSDFTNGGVKPGDLLYISGSTSNDGMQTIESLADNTITVYGTFATESTGAVITLNAYRYEEHEGVSIDTVAGITSPLTMAGHNSVGFYSGRAMLIDGNRVDYSLPDAPWIYNGVNTSNGGETSLFFGDTKSITSTHSLFNRYGSNILESWVVTKDNETYMLTGSQPYYDYNEPFVKRTISTNIGCPAPMTMKSVEIGFEVAQEARRNALMWLDTTGPVLFDGAVLSPVSGIENYFDQSKSECVKYSLIGKATAYYDPIHYEYNICFASGASATKNNTWLVYDLKKRAWYQKDISATDDGYAPIYTISVSDSNGGKYNYGHLSDGFLVRLDNGQVWSGSVHEVAIVQEIKTGEFSPPLVDKNGFWTQSELKSLKIISEATTEDRDITTTIYANGSASAKTQTIAINSGSNLSRNTMDVNALGIQAFTFQADFAATTSSEKWEPLAWGYKAATIRED